MVAILEVNQRSAVPGAAIAWDTEFISMHILPEYKRQGIGRKLFSSAAKRMKEHGCKSVYTWLLEANHPARRFCEALGRGLAGRHQIKLGERALTGVAYVWKDIDQLENFE